MPALPDLSPVDISALALIVVGALVGAFRGLAGELAGLISAVLSFVAGLLLRVPLGLWFTTHSRISDDAAYATAFCLVVILTWLLLLIPKLIVGKVMKVVFEKGFNIVGGIIGGTLRMTTWVVILFLAMQMIPHDYLNRHFGANSYLGQAIHRVAPEIITTTAGLDSGDAVEAVVDDVSSTLQDE